MTQATYGTHPVTTRPAPGLPDYLVLFDYDAPSLEAFMDLPLRSCDYVGCFASEIEDIVERGGTDLIPIYLDTRHDVCMCHRCYEAGKHLDEGEEIR